MLTTTTGPFIVAWLGPIRGSEAKKKEFEALNPKWALKIAHVLGVAIHAGSGSCIKALHMEGERRQAPCGGPCCDHGGGLRFVFGSEAHHPTRRARDETILGEERVHWRALLKSRSNKPHIFCAGARVFLN